MRCPHCQKEMQDGTGICPQCGQKNSCGSEVLEPELVDEHDRPLNPRPILGQQSQAQNSRQNSYTRIFYTTFPGGARGGLPPACLPTAITLALTLIVAFNYGLLAAIGFLVFAGIGRAVTFFLTIRHFLEGRFVNPWLFHGATWIICWLLVAWLSGDM